VKARDRLAKAVELDGRFSVELRVSIDENTIFVQQVRLTQAKEYCGQHPGECVVIPGFQRKKKRMRYLEWDDWIQFNNLVNDVLDKGRVKAEVWSTPMENLDKGKKFWIRKGLLRRVKYDYREVPTGGVPIRIWNTGSPDQFEQRVWEVSTRGMTPEKVEDFARQAQEECDEKIRQFVRPLIVQEFERVKKRKPSLRRIIFGNGTYFIEFEDDTSWTLGDDVPEYAKRLDRYCFAVADIGVEDVGEARHEREEALAARL
jgi:hypothetical protein